MEALVAVGLAGNVVQFVQSAGTLIALAKDIQNNGKPNSLAELEQISKTLVDQTAGLRTRLEAAGAVLTVENQV
jgi:hypothetical protein